METLNTDISTFKLSTTHSYQLATSNLGKSGIVPQINFNLPFDSIVFLRLTDDDGNTVQVLINGDFVKRGHYSNKMELNKLNPGDYNCIIETDRFKEIRQIKVFG